MDTDWKREVKVLLHVDDMTVHISDPRNSNSKLLKLINTFIRIGRHKLTHKKSVAFLYTSDRLIKHGHDTFY